MWTMAVLLLSGLARAEELRVGIPVEGVDVLGAPDFLTPELGWTAPIEGGFVRVFVGASEAEAIAWVQQAQMAITVSLPVLPGLGDEAYGDTSGLLILRDRNVALQVRASGNAGAIAEAMLAAMPTEPVAWPAPPQLHQVEDGRWQVTAPGAVKVQFDDGGRVTPGEPELTFSEPPGTIIAWDAWGRPAIRAE